MSQTMNLPILVIVRSETTQATVVAKQTFSYTWSKTPSVQNVFPAVSYGGSGSKIHFLGHHRIQDVGWDKEMGEIYGVYIGDTLCSRFGIFQ
jgi:hypothetical protein